MRTCFKIHKYKFRYTRQMFVDQVIFNVNIRTHRLRRISPLDVYPIEIDYMAQIPLEAQSLQNHLSTLSQNQSHPVLWTNVED